MISVFGVGSLTSASNASSMVTTPKRLSHALDITRFLLAVKIVLTSGTMKSPGLTP